MERTIRWEIELRPGSARSKVAEHIWRSWTGRRFADGIEYHGPVESIDGTPAPATQRRECKCPECGAFAEIIFGERQRGWKETA